MSVTSKVHIPELVRKVRIACSTHFEFFFLLKCCKVKGYYVSQIASDSERTIQGKSNRFVRQSQNLMKETLIFIDYFRKMYV